MTIIVKPEALGKIRLQYPGVKIPSYWCLKPAEELPIKMIECGDAVLVARGWELNRYAGAKPKTGIKFGVLVGDYAKRIGKTRQWAHELIRTGGIRAERIGPLWIVLE